MRTLSLLALSFFAAAAANAETTKEIHVNGKKAYLHVSVSTAAGFVTAAWAHVTAEPASNSRRVNVKKLCLQVQGAANEEVCRWNASSVELKEGFVQLGFNDDGLQSIGGGPGFPAAKATVGRRSVKERAYLLKVWN